MRFDKQWRGVQIASAPLFLWALHLRVANLRAKIRDTWGDAMKTLSSPVLVPPPPVPPGRNASGAADDGPARGGRKAHSLLDDMWLELRRIEWPSRVEVVAGSLVTMGLLGLFAGYIFVTEIVVRGVMQLLGVNI